jgi:UDP-N-acetylglucosamine 3-dehydrogenase
MSTADRLVRLAIVGAGHIGARHAACAAQIAEGEVVAVWSRTPASAAGLAGRVGARTCATLQEMAEAPDIDAAIVCTPNALHPEAAIALARGGKHVICEKPLARTLDQAQAMLQAAREAGVHLLVAHVVRFFPAFRRLRDLIREGAIGKPAVIRMSRETDAAPEGWRADLAMSGGALLEMGVHDLDWLLWACGPAKRVTCRTISRGGHSAPDYALTTLRLASGAIAHVESSMVAAAGFRTHGEIAGDSGLLAYDSDQDTALRIELREPGPAPGIQIPTTFTTESPYMSQLRHFCRCIQGVETPQIAPEEAFAALQVALAALESATTGRTVEL